MRSLILLMILIAMASELAAQPGFKDHGIAAPATESRGMALIQDAAGHNLAIILTNDLSPRGFLLVVDLDQGKTEQIYYPEGVPNSPPFASLVSRNGRFYTGAGPTLLEFDPSTRQFLFHGVPNPQAGCFVGEAFADGPDHFIYVGTYPDCRVYSFNTQSKEIQEIGQLDPQEKYLNYLAVDSAGWIYGGIGTARWNIVAIHPQTKERRQLLDEAERKTGTAYVYSGVDGKAYGRAGDLCFRLFEGKAERIKPEEMAARVPGPFGWGVASGTLPDKRVVKLNLPEKYITISQPDTQETKKIVLSFESGGAMLTSLIAGPDGKIYGSSAHPMHFFVYDPQADKLTDLGPVRRVGGGNFCAMAVQGPYIAAASYSLGIFHLFDTRKPFNGGFGEEPNPRELAEWPKEICRPRACLAHPNGEEIMMAGYAGYGLCGGGLGIYNLRTQQATLLTHEQLIPNQSTIALAALPDGRIVGSTSIEAPGGGHPLAKEAVVYILDWATKKVVFQQAPYPGEANLPSLIVGPDGLVYGVSGRSKLYVLNPSRPEIVRTDVDLSAYGNIVRPGMILGPDKNIYAAFSRAIVRIQPGSCTHEKIAEAPMGISAGPAFFNGRLYFASGARLWSYALPL